MMIQKRLLICFVLLFLVFINSGNAKENKINKKKPERRDKISCDLKDKEKQIRQLKDEAACLKKEKGQITKQTGVLIKEITALKEKINTMERDRVFLESMINCRYQDLKAPKPINAQENNFNKIIYLNTGYAYAMEKKYTEAVEQYRKALLYDSKDPDIHYNLGYLLAKKNKCKEAVEEYKKALIGVPEDREIYYNLSIIYTACVKDVKTAGYYYNKYLKLSSSLDTRDTSFDH